MPLFGNIVVIRRNGTDGITFPLTASSCSFGRRTECDIRIQLPQVSKEHCKIEVNENKEAILTNLSTVNPTKLNGGYFQQPVTLKHGDLLTIIDRSFRFEYPPQSTPRKRPSRSPKDETLQVLHVQQVAEVELLHKPTSGSKNLQAPDNAECEEKKGNENKESTEEICKALPLQLQTPKASYRIHQSLKEQNALSPFSELYEKLKHEMKVKKSLQGGNAPQQAAKEDAKGVLLQPSAPVSSSAVCDLGSLPQEKERSGNIEECKITMKQEAIASELKQISAVGSATKKSCTRSLPPSVSNEVSGDSDNRNHLQDQKELSAAGKAKAAEVPTTPSKRSGGNAAAFSLQQCSIERLGCGDRMKRYSSATARTTGTANVAEVNVLCTPTSRRKSSQSHFTSPARDRSEMNLLNADTPKSHRRVPLKRRSLSEVLAETHKEGSGCRDDSHKQHTPGKPAKEEVLREICDQANLNLKKGHAGTPASLSNAKNPRRSSRQSKELSNKSVHSEPLASEGLTSELTSPAAQKSGSGRKRGRPRSSGLLTEKALEINAVQDKNTDGKDSDKKEELEDGSIKRPRRLSSKRRSSGSATTPKDTEAVSAMDISGLLAGEESGKRKRISQKRKSEELVLQPLGKRKRVSFGGQLSPELFDKRLPPNSPLKRGATPARLSLLLGNSPRAVLKKTQEHLQKEKRSPKTLPAPKSPAASSPASGKATPPCTSASPAASRRGRVSVAHITAPFPIPEEKESVAEDMKTKEKSDAQVQTPQSAPVKQEDKIFLTALPEQVPRSAQLPLKVTPMKRRSGAVALINAKRKSGASSANLLVAKSWAEVVKSGAARPQARTVKKNVQKGRALKKTMQPPQTPERKIKGHFSTGHAESPATIVIGRAYSTTVRKAGQVPKVVKNPLWKPNMTMDESFTGMTEMFQTPENKSGNPFPVATPQEPDLTPTWSAEEFSELHTPEEIGEMMVSPLNNSDASEEKQDSPGISHFLRGEESLKSVFDAIATRTPRRRKAVLEENVSVDSSPVIAEKQASQVKSGRKRRTPKQKLEPVGASSGIKQLMKTPKQRSEPVEALSGIKQLMKTPKQKPQPVEALSGIKQLMKTPKQKLEAAEILSGIKQLMRTPKQKPEPAEVLSGIKQLMKTPKQKPEPAEVLSGIKQLMRTPKQRSEPVEALSGIKQLMKTPKQKPEPVEALSGIKQLMKTPKQRSEPVEALSGIKQLVKTPKQKPEPAEVLSGIKELMKTPQEELEPVLDAVAFQRLLKTPAEEREAVEDVAGVKLIKKTPKLKDQAVEDMVGISRIFRTPKEKAEPVEDMFGITRLVKTPREKYQPVDDFVGLQRLLAEPRQKKCSSSEVDYVGVTEMFATPEEIKVRSGGVMASKQEDPAPPSTNSSHNHGEDSQQKESSSGDQSTARATRGRPRNRGDAASARQCEKDLNPTELQDLEQKSTQEEMGEIRTSASGAKSGGRGRRANHCVQEEIVSGHLEQEAVGAVSPRGATQRAGRGRRKELKELKHPSESLEFGSKDSAVLQKEPAKRKQTLQEHGISDILETDDDPTKKTESVASNIPHEACQLPPGLINPENRSTEGGVEASEEILMSPGRRSRGVKKAESTEPLIPPRRGRRARNEQVQQASSEDLHGPTRRLCRNPSARAKELTSDKAPESAPAGEPDHKPEIKRTDKRVKSLRSARKNSPEAPENAQSIQKTKETSTEADPKPQSGIQNEIQVSQGDNAQGNPTEASQRLKTESPCGETTRMPLTAVNLEANKSAVQETNRTRNRRGKKDSLETKPDETAKDVNSGELITPKLKSEREMDESSLLLGSVCVQNTEQAVEDEKSPAATSVSASNSERLAHSSQKRTRNGQGVLKPKGTEILKENQAQKKETTYRRGRGRKVNSQLEEANSKAVEGKRSLPGDDKAMTYKDDQQETSENPPSQVKRSRRKQADSTPQIACSALMGKQPLIADDRKAEALVKEQDCALEAAPSSEDNPPRRGRRREVTAAAQPPRALATRRQGGLLEGDGKKLTGREDQNAALGKKTLQAEANASARDRRKKLGLAAEAKSSSPLQGKCGFSETGDKKEATNEKQNTPLETVSCATGKLLGRGRRKETALTSQTVDYISLRGKSGLPAGSGGEEALKDNQNVPLETSASSVKENQLRRGRRKEIALQLETTSSAEGKQGLSGERGRKNNSRQAKQLILEKSASQEKVEFSEENSRQTVTSLAPSSTSLQGLPEDGKNATPGEQQSLLLEPTAPARENPPRGSRKKTIASKSEGSSSTFLREKPALPRGRGQKRSLQEGEAPSLGNNSSQEKPRQLRNKRQKVEFPAEAATSPWKSSNLPANGSTWQSQKVCLTSESRHQPGKETSPVQQAPSLRRKWQLPADNLAPKKLKAESDAKGAKGRRNPRKEEHAKEDLKLPQPAGGTERKTRSSTRPRK